MAFPLADINRLEAIYSGGGLTQYGIAPAVSAENSLITSGQLPPPWDLLTKSTIFTTQFYSTIFRLRSFAAASRYESMKTAVWTVETSRPVTLAGKPRGNAASSCRYADDASKRYWIVSIRHDHP